MKLPALLLLAGCAAGQSPYSPTREVHYSALGHGPFWMVTVGEKKIVLTSGPADEGRTKLRGREYRRVSARMEEGVRRWQAGEGTAVISVEARPGPCIGSRGARFEDAVRIRLSGRELHGCGGRRLDDGRG